MEQSTQSRGETETQKEKMNSIYDFTKGKKDEIDKESKILGAQAATAILGIIFGPFVVWAAWNVVMPALFGLPTIGYVYSLALYVLVKTLK
jgi:uncharacterized membrane protein